MTYKELAESILKLTPEQQGTEVTVSCDLKEEAFPVKYFSFIQEEDFLSDVLNTGHPILAIDV